MHAHCKIFKQYLNIQRNKWDSAFIAHNSPFLLWSLELTPAEQFWGYSSRAFSIVYTSFCYVAFLIELAISCKVNSLYPS